MQATGIEMRADRVNEAAGLRDEARHEVEAVRSFGASCFSRRLLRDWRGALELRLKHAAPALRRFKERQALAGESVCSKSHDYAEPFPRLKHAAPALRRLERRASADVFCVTGALEPRLKHAAP